MLAGEISLFPAQSSYGDGTLNPLTEATGCFGGIAIHICTWSGIDLPPFSVPIIKRVPGQFLAFVVLSGAAGGGEPPRRL